MKADFSRPISRADRMLFMQEGRIQEGRILEQHEPWDGDREGGVADINGPQQEEHELRVFALQVFEDGQGAELRVPEWHGSQAQKGSDLQSDQVNIKTQVMFSDTSQKTLKKTYAGYQNDKDDEEGEGGHVFEPGDHEGVKIFDMSIHIHALHSKTPFRSYLSQM